MNTKNKQSNNLPNLRFPGFEGEWERKKLGDVAKRINTKNHENKINLVFSNSATQGIIFQVDYFDKNIANKSNLDGYYIVKPLNFVYNPRISAHAEVGAMSLNKTGEIGLVSPLYTVFKITDTSVDVLYIEALFSSKVWHSYIRSIANYGARDDRMSIKNEDFLTLSLKIPSIREQQKIANFLNLIDERIQTQMKIIEGLEKLIKGLQEQIFSQKLRFKDENGNKFAGWEDYLLSEILIKNSERNKRLKYANIQSVSNKYGFINQEKLFEDRRIASKNTSNYYIIRKGVFAYNPSRIDVGSLAYKFDDNTSIISPLYISFWVDQAYIVDEFLLNWFMTQYFTIQINNLFEGSVRNTLSFESFGKVKINLPSIEEQKAIANFLSSINQRIDNERQLLTQYQNQKKFLLQNLFI